MSEDERRRYKPDLDVRVSLLEQWRGQHDEWAAHQAERLDVVWDWRAEVRPILKTTNRLMVAILTVLVGDLLGTIYLLFFGNVK